MGEAGRRKARRGPEGEPGRRAELAMVRTTVSRTSFSPLTLPASRCASPRKKRLPKQYMLDNQLARLARLSDSSGKNDDNSGIVQMSTVRQADTERARGPHHSTRAALLRPVSRMPSIRPAGSLRVDAPQRPRVMAVHRPCHPLLHQWPRTPPAEEAARRWADPSGRRVSC